MILPLLWALLAALALALSWLTGAQAFAWVGYLMLIIWIIAFATSRMAERGLAATRRLSADRMSHGGEIVVEVEVVNHSRLPLLWLIASETLPAGLPMIGSRGWVGPVPARGRFGYRYAIQGARRGYYQLGPTVLRTGDLFGLAQRERLGTELAWFTVFPRIVPLQRAGLPSRRPISEVRTRHRTLEDPTQVIGVRPYQHGDGLRRVHWRATAHTGRLQSKLFEISAQMETTIVLDLRRDDYPVSPSRAQEIAELAIVAAASIAHHLLQQRQRVGLVAVATDPAHRSLRPNGVVRLPASRDRNQLAAILSVLGRIELGPGEELTAILDQEKDHLPWGSLVVLIAPGADEEIVAALLGLRKTGFEPSLVVVGASPVSSSRPAALQALGISAATVTSEADIRALGL